MPFLRMNAIALVTAPIAAICLIATPAAAQNTQAPAQAAILATPAFARTVEGKSIVVITTDGRRYEGIFRISGNTLVMSDSGLQVATPTTVPFSEVARVQKSTYRIRQHTLIGLAVGAGVGTAVGVLLCGSDCDGDPLWLGFTAVGTGIGAGVGAGNGFLQNTRNFDNDIVYDIGQRLEAGTGIAPLSRIGSPEFAQEVEGKDVWINTADGQKRRGEIAVVTTSGLVLMGPQHGYLPFNQITSIVEVSHRIRNGMINGLAAGAGLGFLTFAAGDCSQNASCGKPFFGLSALGLGIGAAVGALMNLDDDRDLLYSAGQRTTTLAIAPMLSKTSKGVNVTVTWR